MLLALTMALSLPQIDNETLKKRGFEVLEQIRREYYLPKSKLYCDSIEVSKTAYGQRPTANDSGSANRQLPTANPKQSGPAFNWGVGVMLSALNAAARLDPKYKAWLREFADACRVYWNDKGPVPGYDVLPCPKPVDRYYDDNAWMVLALVETYEILKDKKYLDWAEQALDYVLSGEDAKLGGGIYWRESDKKSKNTCSNAPSAAACLAVAKYRRSDELKAKAKSLLEWTKQTFQDPEDGLFWDNISLDGKLDKTKWSYNTGLYLRSKAMIGSTEDDLRMTFRWSRGRWIEPATRAIKDSGRFAHLWIEGMTAIHPIVARQPYIWNGANRPPSFFSTLTFDPIRLPALEYVWTHCRNPQGRFGDMWDRPFDPKRTKFELIDQASVARALLFAAKR
jgi:hypothetical protein